MNCNGLRKAQVLTSKRSMCFKTLLFLTLVFFLCQAAMDCFAECVLPSSLEIIEEEAFQGDTSLRSVTMTDSVTAIRSKAFAATAIYSIAIPSSVISIADDAFANVKTPLLIETSPNALAVSFALNHNLDFRAGTACRALLIGQTKYPYPYRLEGPSKDINHMKSVLSGFNVTTKTSLKADEIYDAIRTTFADAKNEDISLFFFSGHGRTDGALVGIDLESYVTPNDLRLALDNIPGRKIVLIDSCYSGAMIGKSSPENSEEDMDPALLFINAFAATKRGLLLTAQQYYVMAASNKNEQSWETQNGGLFTTAFADSKTSADANHDGVITFEEAYQYIRNSVREAASTGGHSQSVQVYPTNCYWFGLFR